MDSLKKYAGAARDLLIVYVLSDWCPDIFDLGIYGGIGIVWYGLSFFSTGLAWAVGGLLLFIHGMIGALR